MTIFFWVCSTEIYMEAGWEFSLNYLMLQLAGERGKNKTQEKRNAEYIAQVIIHTFSFCFLTKH